MNDIAVIDIINFLALNELLKLVPEFFRILQFPEIILAAGYVAVGEFLGELGEGVEDGWLVDGGGKVSVFFRFSKFYFQKKI